MNRVAAAVRRRKTLIRGVLRRVTATDGMLQFLCWGGALLSLFLVAGLAPVPVLILLWLFYLSLFTVCRVFLGYQWDILLLETGFLAIFIAPFEVLPRIPHAAAPSS